MNWDYIAGFFDGEGCFSVYYDKNKRVKYQVSISQTNEKILKDIQKYIGFGKVYNADHKGNKNWKSSWLVAYSLRISKRADILSFIDQIEDKIIVKKDEIKTKKKMLIELDLIKSKKWEKIRYNLKICKKMRDSKKSWKEIGETINKNAESARCFVKEHRNKIEHYDIFG